MNPPRGRRPKRTGDATATRDLITAAARRQFAEHGYPATTLRTIAAEAGVNTRLVTHYFGSKQALFVEVVELPIRASEILASLGRLDEAAGLRAARFVLSALETPGAREVLTGLVRAAASEERAAALVRELWVDRMLTPLVEGLGGDNAELRASLAGSVIAGFAYARWIVGLPALTAADSETIAAMLAPVLNHFLTGSAGVPWEPLNGDGEQPGVDAAAGAVSR